MCWKVKLHIDELEWNDYGRDKQKSSNEEKIECQQTKQKCI